MNGESDSQEWSRRAVLTTAGALGAAAIAPTTASARYTVDAVIPEAEQFTGGEGYAGYFLHIGGESNKDISASKLEGCELGEWSPESIRAFNAHLIDRLEEPSRELPTQVYVAGNAEVSSGSLWVVNRDVSCPDEYVGLEVEQIGVSDIREENDPFKRQGTTQGGGPGFGAAAALAGVAGGLGLLRRRGDDE